jgi:polyisoprenoid-binding protein YceI
VTLWIVLSATLSLAQFHVFELDPAKSTVEFTLDASLHTVHGSFQLKNGSLRFNSNTGEASGELVLETLTGKTGNNSRDAKMKNEVLEVEKYPTIVFIAKKVVGKLASAGTSEVQLEGAMLVHGQPHPMTLTFPVAVNGTEASADVPFTVPYVEWGLKNPSTFLLRVSKSVRVVVHAAGTFSTTSAP